MRKTALPRLPLAFLPTPLHPLPRLTEQLPSAGVRLWIKRDDQTGLAGGGNKTRKLEYLLADALEQNADVILTTGAVQSNHCRQTAAAAARLGLECRLVLGGEPPAHVNGNLLLDGLLGATLHWTNRANRLLCMNALADDLRAAGRRPYPITYGGSDPVGARGYVNAMEELHAQCAACGLKPAAIFFASSSGGTQAGLLTGAAMLGWDVPIVGISVDEPAKRLREMVARLATATAAGLGLGRIFTPAEVHVEDDYLGGGYGVMGDLEREAIRLLAQTEGILLDPVYTGRAFGGLLDLLWRAPERLLSEGGTGGEIIFWHTGGAPALFAYADELRT